MAYEVADTCSVCGIFEVCIRWWSFAWPFCRRISLNFDVSVYSTRTSLAAMLMMKIEMSDDATRTKKGRPKHHEAMIALKIDQKRHFHIAISCSPTCTRFNKGGINLQPSIEAIATMLTYMLHHAQVASCTLPSASCISLNARFIQRISMRS